MRLERDYQRYLKNKILNLLPGSYIFKMDQIQGIPDLLILYEGRWAMLECKADSTSSIRPNQRYYVNKFNDMSFAAFIFPENEEAVLNELQQAFGLTR